MTNYKVYRKFRETFIDSDHCPGAVDYRPLASAFVEDREGITIWLDNGDVILYFPSQGEVARVEKGIKEDDK